MIASFFSHRSCIFLVQVTVKKTKDKTPNPSLSLSLFMEFRHRNYSAELESHALPRLRAGAHPLSAPPPPPPLSQVFLVSQFLSQFVFLLLTIRLPCLSSCCDYPESVLHSPFRMHHEIYQFFFYCVELGFSCIILK